VASASNPEAVWVRLIGFNDFHGNLEPHGLTLPWVVGPGSQRPQRLATGGAAALGGLVKALRASAPHSIVVHSGDLFGATPLASALFHHEPSIAFANRLGVDVGTVGNHEFDAGAAELKRLLQGGCASHAPSHPARTVCARGPHPGARFPTVVANVQDASGQPLLPRSTVLERGGVRIGFVGAVTRRTAGMVRGSGIRGLQFADEVQALNDEARRLRAQGVRTLVALVHEGGQTHSSNGALDWNSGECQEPRGRIFEIARRLDPAYAVVFSAHTHQGYACVMGGRHIVQATALGRGLSVVELPVDAHTGQALVSGIRSRNLPVLNPASEPHLRAAVLAAEPPPWSEILSTAEPDEAIAAEVAAWVLAAAPLAKRPVGRITAEFDRHGRTDSPAGRLVADAQLAATAAPERGGAHLALTNPGGLRRDLRCPQEPPCDVNYGDVFAMQPFGNNLVVMTLDGAQLKRLLEDQQPPGDRSPLFLAPSHNLRYAWHPHKPHGQRVQQLQLNGRRVTAGQRIRLTVNDYLAEGGDGFKALRRGRERTGGPPDAEALADYLARPGAVGTQPDVEPRISWQEPVNPR
jgi:5'-nucleotidase